MSRAQFGGHTLRSHGTKVARVHLHDWLILPLLVAIDAGLNIIEPFHRFIGAEIMTDMKYPLKIPDTMPFWFVPVFVTLLCLHAVYATLQDHLLERKGLEKEDEYIVSHSFIHDQIIEQRKRPGGQVYSVMPQVYEEPGVLKPLNRKGRALLSVSESLRLQKDVKLSIII